MPIAIVNQAQGIKMVMSFQNIFFILYSSESKKQILVDTVPGSIVASHCQRSELVCVCQGFGLSDYNEQNIEYTGVAMAMPLVMR